MIKIKNKGKSNNYVYDISLDGTVVNALGLNVLSNTDGFNFKLPDSKDYRYTDGYPKNTIENIDGSWYYFDQDGYRVTGWEKIENHWYYFDEDGKKVVSQWIGDYYVDEEGIMAADTWIGNDHVNKYGLKDDTAGWKHDGKGWWYLNAGGGYPKSIWKQETY